MNTMSEISETSETIVYTNLLIAEVNHLQITKCS